MLEVYLFTFLPYNIYFLLANAQLHFFPKLSSYLSLIANSIFPFHQYILTYSKPPSYVWTISYVSLLNLPDVHLNNFLFGTLLLDLKSTSPTVINNFFSDFLYTNFPDFIAMYIDGSVSPLSAGYFFYIPALHMSFTSNYHLFFLHRWVLCHCRSAHVDFFFSPKQIFNHIWVRCHVFNL